MSFTVASLAGLGLTAGFAARTRGLRAATFLTIVLSIHVAVSIAIYPLVGFAGPLLWALQIATLLSVASLLTPGLRSLPWRALVDWPASAFIAGTFLAIPWAILRIGPWEPWGIALPYALAAFGLVQSLTARREQVALDLRQPHTPTLSRNNAALTRAIGANAVLELSTPPVRIFQITDPHLGTFMSVKRLAALCQRAVDSEADLILLTGDFLTFATNHDADSLAAALAPLRDHPHVYACPGNHDHEAPETVNRALAAVGARMLIDASVVVDTPAGPVEVMGLNHRWRQSAEHLHSVLSRPRPLRDGKPVPRIAMLHDPLRFDDCPDGSVDLALSGHTHGGQVGLVSLGRDWTVVSGLFKMVDHGLWSKGHNHLYIHRGQGHYGFPLRIGVPAEESVLSVRF
jgi:predicted MPP superfamily phosphohydrolase